ncbi:MAG: electron transport complex subunit RsxE [Clostridia bacterium]|nr:electron transport complex subunit RsxE [Clostridia bacterium]
MRSEHKLSLGSIFLRGVLRENPVLGMALGICSALAVTTSIIDALSMGAAVTFVLVGANLLISAIRNHIPSKVRIPVFIVIICTFVTIAELIFKAYFPVLDRALGVFLSLIVVNCVILARAESFASKNTAPAALMDALGAGLGYTLALLCVSAFREVVGSGTFLGIPLFGDRFEPMLLFVMAPGAFIALGILIGLANLLTERSKARVSARSASAKRSRHEDISSDTTAAKGGAA